MFAFDSDTTNVTALSDRWNALAGVNGGFMLAVCLRELGQVMPFPDPLVVSGFFLRPGTPGPATVSSAVLRAGKTTAFGQAVLSQGEREIVRATAAFTTLNDEPASFTDLKPPSLPPPDECVGPPTGDLPGVTIADRVEYRVPTLPGWHVHPLRGRRLPRRGLRDLGFLRRSGRPVPPAGPRPQVAL
jgi:acyl-CoA thioesterase